VKPIFNQSINSEFHQPPLKKFEIPHTYKLKYESTEEGKKASESVKKPSLIESNIEGGTLGAAMRKSSESFHP
jgi:hypothetical protein